MRWGLDLFTKMMDGGHRRNRRRGRFTGRGAGDAVRTTVLTTISLTPPLGDSAVISSRPGWTPGPTDLWPTRTVVYEIDQPKVMEFKTTTLADGRRTLHVRRRAIDLHDLADITSRRV